MPACLLATVAFESAAASQAQALGFAAAVHFVPHPIQNRTAAEIEAIADDVVEAVLAAIGPARPEQDDQ